jgi:hypothetical protein
MQWKANRAELHGHPSRSGAEVSEAHTLYRGEVVKLHCAQYLPSSLWVDSDAGHSARVVALP